VLLATRPQVNRTVTVNSRLANRAVNRAFLQPALKITLLHETSGDLSGGYSTQPFLLADNDIMLTPVFRW